MKIIINYVVQGENNSWRNSETLKLIPSLYSPGPLQSDIDKEIEKWTKQKQIDLNKGERIVILSTLYG
jgi:hypothetical protein